MFVCSYREEGGSFAVISEIFLKKFPRSVIEKGRDEAEKLSNVSRAFMTFFGFSFDSISIDSW